MGERGQDCIPEKNFLEDVLKQSTVVGRKSYFCGAEFVERIFL